MTPMGRKPGDGRKGNIVIPLRGTCSPLALQRRQDTDEMNIACGHLRRSPRCAPIMPQGLQEVYRMKDRFRPDEGHFAW
jgi:hypothetical protein